MSKDPIAQWQGSKIVGYEIALPVTVGGSKISSDRVDGPPSKKYPILRDLADADARVTIEIDTDKARYEGTIAGTSLYKGNQEQDLYIETEGTPRTPRRMIKFSSILAFRVLKIEVDALPAKL